VEGAVHLNHRLRAPHCSGQGDLQIITKISSGGLPQVGLTGKAEKFFEKLVIISKLGAAQIIRGGP
jgi:hypothetical protein